MIATLNFEKSLASLSGEPELAPGLHRIDEILVAVLARYDSAAARSPRMSNDRFARDDRESSLVARSKPLPR